MKLHPRFHLCKEAENEMRGALLEISQRHELTDIEYLRAVNEACSASIASCLKYMLRVERHGNPEDQADAAGDGTKSAATFEFTQRLLDAVIEELDVDLNTSSRGDLTNFDKALNLAYRMLREEF